jgi:uncharacterized protein YjbI with pentapeptide repeats
VHPPQTFRELLERYQRGDRDFAKSDLDQDPDNDCRGICLEGADLSGSYIVADFRRASLRGAKFVEANVKTCDFREADLRNADFSGAALCATYFVGADMTGARFDGAHFHGYRLRSAERPDW